MADKVYATLKIEAEVKVLVRGDDGVDYGNVLKNLTLGIEATDDTDDECMVEIGDTTVKIISADITDAK